MTEPSLKDFALFHLVAGFEIFPLQPKSKFPYKGSSGFKDATNDKAKVERWWSIAPMSNIGVRVPQDVVVVDLDPRNGADEEFTFNVLRGLPRDTFTVTSGRGDGGKHFYYKLPEGAPKIKDHIKILPGVDFRAQGKGYLLGFGSIHPDTGNSYEWNQKPFKYVPSGVVFQMSVKTYQDKIPQTTYGTEPFSVKAMDDIIADLKYFGIVGKRNEALRVAAFRAFHFKEAPSNLGDVLLEEGMKLGLPRAECLKTILSAKRGAQERLKND